MPGTPSTRPIDPTLTITVDEGLFVYRGVSETGSASWLFLENKKDGTRKPAPMPRRFRGALAREKHDDN